MEPIAGRSDVDGTINGGKGNWKLYRKMQGPIVGMLQAAIVLGGSLETDTEGFRHMFNGVFPSIHLNTGTDNEWKAKVTTTTAQATIGQLTDRLVDPNEVERTTPPREKNERGKTCMAYVRRSTPLPQQV